MAAGNLDSTVDDVWKRIWKLSCPKNIQMFAWRIKHESLALRTNIEHRGIPIADTKCLFCGRADEDGAHLFIKCKCVKEGWRELALEKERMELEGITSVHAMFDYLWGLDEGKRLWWSNRNKLREGELPHEATDVAQKTRYSVLEYQHIFMTPPKKVPLDKWKPPDGDMIKINLDGSFVPGEDVAGWGVVARTADGNIVGARAGRQENVRDAFPAETYALSHVVSFAADLGIVRVILETDSQLLLEAMDLHKSDSSAYAAIIEDTKYQLKMWFSHHVILVCRRTANSVAHELASMGRLCVPNHCMQWESDVPAAVAVCALADVGQHS